MPSLNYNEGKARLSLVLSDAKHAFAALVDAFEEGAQKYGRANWREDIGTPAGPTWEADNVDSMGRHLFAVMRGEEIDPEGGNHHFLKIAARALMGFEYYVGRVDDSDAQPLKKSYYCPFCSCEGCHEVAAAYDEEIGGPESNID